MAARLSLPRSQQRHSNVAVVRYNGEGITLEVPCYKNKALAYRQGLESSVDEVLQVGRIFSNVSRGEYASLSDIRKALKNKKIKEDEAIRYILTNGDMQVGAGERVEESGVLWRDVCSIVAQKCVHPITRRCYPFNMIDQAMHTIGFSLRLDMDAKPQALRAINELCAKQVLPIRRAPMRIRIYTSNSALAVEFLRSIEAENVFLRALPELSAASTPARVTSLMPSTQPSTSTTPATTALAAQSTVTPAGQVAASHLGPSSSTAAGAAAAADPSRRSFPAFPSQVLPSVGSQQDVTASASVASASEQPSPASAASTTKSSDFQDVVADVSPDLFRKIDAWVGSSLPEGSTLAVIIPCVVDTSEGDASAITSDNAAVSAAAATAAAVVASSSASAAVALSSSASPGDSLPPGRSPGASLMSSIRSTPASKAVSSERSSESGKTKSSQQTGGGQATQQQQQQQQQQQHLSAKQRRAMRNEARNAKTKDAISESDDDEDTAKHGRGKRGKRRGAKHQQQQQQGHESEPESSEDEDTKLNRKDRLKKQAHEEARRLAEAAEEDEAWKDGVFDEEEGADE